MTKLVTAIIKPHMLDAVKDALQGLGIKGMTVTDVRGFGRQGGHTETYRGTEYTVDLIPKIRLDVVCASEQVEAVVDMIRATANSGKIGDGKTWVTDVERLVRHRTGEEGPEAI